MKRIAARGVAEGRCTDSLCRATVSGADCARRSAWGTRDAGGTSATLMGRCRGRQFRTGPQPRRKQTASSAFPLRGKLALYRNTARHGYPFVAEVERTPESILKADQTERDARRLRMRVAIGGAAAGLAGAVALLTW